LPKSGSQTLRAKLSSRAVSTNDVYNSSKQIYEKNLTKYRDFSEAQQMIVSCGEYNPLVSYDETRSQRAFKNKDKFDRINRTYDEKWK